MIKEPGGKPEDAPDGAPEEGVSFEQALERLEQLVAQLESGELPLDASIARYEEGRALIGRCYKLLENAERRIEQVVRGEDGALRTAPFEGEPGGEEKPG